MSATVYNATMAEENRTKRNTFEDMVFTLFALLLLAQILNNIPIFLEERFGLTFGGSPSGVLLASAALSMDTPLGTRVSTPNGTAYYGTAGDEGSELGTFPPGTSLVLKDGPVEDALGERWWYVEDPDTGNGGWVLEDVLVKDGVGGLSAATKLGTKVRSIVDGILWQSPAALVALGSMRVGEWGILADGPKEKNGTRWWYFDREGSDDDGWVPESMLTLFSEKGWHSGSLVVGTRDTDLFERAGGGTVLGFLREGERAKVVGGPTMIGGVYWWEVEKDDGTRGWITESALEDGGMRGVMKGIVTTIVVIGTIITIILVGGIVYVTVRTNQIRAREAKRIKAAVPKAMQPKRNDRWDRVQEHVASDNPNDWRHAIIEADIMLDEIVTRMGYQGNTLGDRLKQVARGDMRTIDSAWEAHRVRNQIAHEGSDYILTQREAKRIIDLYGAVFEEFKFI